MREKGEKEAPPRASRAVRLTEFDPQRKDGFVNRMNKETTSFFVTNFPEEAEVMELWTIFAKFGRVGEVYVPKKRDKRGNRFGFVKFKEVTNIEALSSRLEDVWLGTYKLRVNLSLFDRNKVKPSTSHQKSSDAKERNGGASSSGVGGAKVWGEKTFKSVVTNDKSAVQTPTTEVEVVGEVMEVLEGSYVGRLKKGVEVRALQMKLWLAGMHAVRAVAMGSGMVLLFRDSGDEVGEPVRNLDWWGGLLTEIKTWSPNLVCNTREIWVNLFGVPLHAWGISTFSKLVNNCGSFVEVDEGTLKMNRLDVARVKIEAPLCGRIDFVAKIIVQGAYYNVRVKEDEGGVRREEGDVEEQLRRSEVDSSCASGGQASVRAVVEGLDGAVSDSDDSEGEQRDRPMEMQQSLRSKGYKIVLGDDRDKACRDSDSVGVIPSTDKQLIVTGESNKLTSSSEVRGSTLVGQVVCCEQVVNEEGHVTTTLLVSPKPVEVEVGPGRVAKVSGSHAPKGAVKVGLGVVSNKENIPGLGLDKPTKQKSISGGEGVQVAKGQLIDNFVALVQNANGSNGGDSDSCVPVNQSIDLTDSNLPFSKPKKTRRIATPFPSLLGPKCLRFAEVIGNNKRRTSETASLSLESQIQSTSSVVVRSKMGEKTDVLVDKGGEAVIEEVQQQQVPEMELMVCLPFGNSQRADSGIQHLLNEESLKNVDGFIETRESPRLIELEANKLLEDQQVLGVNFNLEKEVPVEKMVKMEARDKSKLQLNQESNGVQ
jgi:hypothetical protein